MAKKQQKDYFGDVNDHSGSMHNLAEAAMKDYNAYIQNTKESANKYEHDIVVSVVGVGYPRGDQVTRQVVISNPHVLKPLTDWPTNGGTPLYDGIGNIIELHENLPDANEEHVSFLIRITTDGQEIDSVRYTKSSLRSKIQAKMKTGRWTFVARVPRGCRQSMLDLGIPSENVQEWDTTIEGLERATQIDTVATTSYVAARSAGAQSSNTFYTSTANVDESKLLEVNPKEFSLYVVPDYSNGIQVRDFILERRTEFLVGAVYYQLSKSEARVSPNAEILLREVATGKVFEGPEVRKMLGLDTLNNARVHPNHGGGKYDVFIQSSSLNRKLVAPWGVIYRPSKGRPVTQADIDKYLGPKAAAAPAAPAVVQLPTAPATGRPTPSPAKTTVKPVAPPPNTVNGRQVLTYSSRDVARKIAKAVGQSVQDRDALGIVAAHLTQRWFIYAN